MFVHFQFTDILFISLGHCLMEVSYFKAISSRWAVMVLLWDVLIYFKILLLRYYTVSSINSSNHSGWPGLDIMYCFIYFSFPFFGLLADVRVGRYKIISFGLLLCFLSWIMSGIGLILKHVHQEYAFLCFLVLAYILETIGYTSFKANIIQYNIDQLVGASAYELSAVIYWHSAGVPISFSVYLLGRCLIPEDYFLCVTFILTGVSVSSVLVSHSLFKHQLENISLIKNPIKLIARVLCYARKHKYPENRSALTYWEEEAPSRLDLGKEKYGGPFTVEEVEDVKTVFRMLPLLIAVVGYSLIDEVYHWVMSKLSICESNVPFLNCVLSTGFAMYLTPALVLLVYLFIFRACFLKLNHKILGRVPIGIACGLAAMISNSVIFYFFPAHVSSSSSNFLPSMCHTLYINKLLFLPQILMGFAFAFIFPATLEFTVAQSPVHLRGVMVGMWLASIGFGYALNISLKYPFGCQNEFICPSYYYYMTRSILLLLILIVFIILAKRYKNRVRENEVNIHQIADDHYTRYINQEEEYSKNP